MNERIQKALDGELPREALSGDERALLTEYEAMLSAAAGTVERHVAPDLTGPVMRRVAAIEAEKRAGTTTAAARAAGTPAAAGWASTDSDPDDAGFGGRIGRALQWLWTPRPVAVRPAWGFAAALLVLALFGTVSELTRETDTPVFVVADQPASGESQIFVHFRLDAPDASSVHLAGDFTEWQPSYELHESRPGVWTVVVPLEAGVHDYAFVVDGERWTPDPLAPAVDDGFGGENSRISLLPPERQRA